MIEWNFDLGECPINEFVLVSFADGEKVRQSQRWPDGRFIGVRPGEVVIAWARLPENVLKGI